MSRPPHKPTDKTRELVGLHATMGTDQETIADLLGIDRKTLAKHYRTELNHSLAKANAKMGGTLYNKALGGDTTAMIFWMKTRARWSEKSELDLTSSDGSMSPKSPTELTDDQLAAIAANINKPG